MYIFMHVNCIATYANLFGSRSNHCKVKQRALATACRRLEANNVDTWAPDCIVTRNKGRIVHRLSAVVLLPSTMEGCSRAVSRRLEQTIVDAKNRSALHRKDARQQWWHSVYLQRRSCSASRRSFADFTWYCRKWVEINNVENDYVRMEYAWTAEESYS